MAIFRVRRLLEFLGRLWLQSFRRAVLVAVIGIIVASVRVSFSQINGSGEGSGFMPTQPDDTGVNSTRNATANGSSLVASCLNSNTRCRDLPAVCLDCNYNDSKNCEYGQDASVSCVPLPGVECQGNQSFEVTFNCRYCYQLNPIDYTCTNNVTCSISSSPSSLYTANCTANDRVFCIPPRTFMQQRRCNYSTGKRWTTAFLLSFTVGGLGIDRFYLNHWASACGKLISFGGLGVWSILDVILVGTGYLGPADGSAYIY